MREFRRVIYRTRFGSELHNGLVWDRAQTRRVPLVAPHQTGCTRTDLCAEECRCLGCRMLPLSTCSLSDLGPAERAAPISLGSTRRAALRPTRPRLGATRRRGAGEQDVGPEWARAQAALSRASDPAGALSLARAAGRRLPAALQRAGAAWLEEGLRAAGLAPAPPASPSTSGGRTRGRRRGRCAGPVRGAAEPFLRASTHLFFVARTGSGAAEEAGAYGPRYTFLHAPTRTRAAEGRDAHREWKVAPRPPRGAGEAGRGGQAAMVDVVALATCGASVVTFSSTSAAPPRPPRERRSALQIGRWCGARWSPSTTLSSPP
eukprot:tig00021762_g23480.t1